MDKLEKVKCILIAEYFEYLSKLQQGYPMNDKGLKREMIKVNFVSNFDLPQWQEDVILDSIRIQNYK